jgi:hypothetical protein
MGVESILAPFMRQAGLCVASTGVTLAHSRVAGLDWRLGRVYFLAFLTPYGDNRTQPLPPGWPVSATVGGPAAELDRFTAMPR